MPASAVHRQRASPGMSLKYSACSRRFQTGPSLNSYPSPICTSWASGSISCSNAGSSTMTVSVTCGASSAVVSGVVTGVGDTHRRCADTGGRIRHRRRPGDELHWALDAPLEPPPALVAHELVLVAAHDRVLEVGGDPHDVGARRRPVAAGGELDE